MLKKAICAWGGLALVAGACVASGGLAPFLDMPSLLIVTLGGLLFSFAKSGNNSFLIFFGKGSVYFGWLAFLIGLILILGNFDLSEQSAIEKLTPALAVATLPVFYGYLFRTLTMFFSIDENS